MRSNLMAPTRTLMLSLIAAGVLIAGETPSPALLVLNKQDSALAIVDPQSGQVVARVPTGPAPHEVTVSADGKFAYTANYGGSRPGSTISVIDLIAQKELRRVNVGLGCRPHGIAFEAGKVYVTAELKRQIERYDPTTNQIDWVFPTGQETTHMIVFTKDLNTIFTANIGSNTVSAIQRASPGAKWNQTVIPVGRGPEGIDLSPDGRELWTAHSEDGGVSIIDVASKRVVQTLEIHTKRSNRLKFTPDGKFVLISDMDGGELVVLDRAARKEIIRIRIGRAPEGILMQPDGSRAYVALAHERTVVALDLKTWKVTQRIVTGTEPDGMAWAVRR